MSYDLVGNIQTCLSSAMLNNDLSLLYYSHLPTAIVSFLFGLFVFFKNKNSIAGKILFVISTSFSLWLIFDLRLWRSGSSMEIMFLWSLLGILGSVIFISSLYFFYAFVDKKDISLNKKIILSLLFLPTLLMTPTILNLERFSDCEAVEGKIFWNYLYAVETAMILWIVVLSFARYRKADKESKKQILFLSIGLILFLLAFLITGFLASYLAGTIFDSFKLEFYGYFGITLFLFFLGVLIVRFKAFNIKLIGAQALVVSLIALIGSQFFFAQNSTSIVLTGVTLALSIGFGYILIKSVKKEVERKDELQLMADKLATANDSLRKLDNAKTEFISIASHQLRTPITAIKGFSSLLLEGAYGEINEGVRGALEKMYSSSERLVTLIEDLLNVSRIESGRMQFVFEKSDVKKLITELYDNFMLIAKNKKFYLDTKFPETPLPEVMMDYSKIRELVSNFIDNALKYTEKGGATIKAELRHDGVLIDENGFVIEGKESPYGQVVRITVSDTGIGIPREEIPYLFKKFSRGKDVSRLHVGGTGLGLYVGKAIADAHHGQVWVESDGAGMGSRFIIEIPVVHI